MTVNLDLIRGRQLVLPLTNKSGAQRVEGEVVVVDVTTDCSFTGTTAEGDDLVAGVVAETIANDAEGRVICSGYAPIVEVDAATSRGDYLKTSTTVGKATPTATFDAGVFAIALSAIGGAGQVSAYLFAVGGGGEGVSADIKSPTKDEFTPIQARMSQSALVWFDGTYFVCDCKAGGHWCSWITAQRLFDYGTYEWKGKFEGPGANCELFFGLEYHHGRLADGIIAFANIGGEYRAYTSWGGNSEFSVLAGENWLAEKTFKFVWDATDVYFYVDTVEKAHHNTYIPQAAMMLFGEAGNRADAKSHFKVNTFEEL